MRYLPPKRRTCTLEHWVDKWADLLVANEALAATQGQPKSEVSIRLELPFLSHRSVVPLCAAAGHPRLLAWMELSTTKSAWWALRFWSGCSLLPVVSCMLGRSDAGRPSHAITACAETFAAKQFLLSGVCWTAAMERMYRRPKHAQEIQVSRIPLSAR